MLAKALLLRQLYLRKLSGEVYCEPIRFSKNKALPQSNIIDTINNCTLCELSKHTKEKISSYHSGDNADIVFVTLKPISQHTASFDMITKIAKNVFDNATYSVFSVIKCNVFVDIKDSHISVCNRYLINELESSASKLIVLFGENVAKCVLNVDDSIENLRGRILNIDKFSHKQKNFIVTYAINDLIKNPSLKKYALEDFNNAKQSMR